MARHSANEEAQDRANKKYKEKHYKRYGLQLRLDDDKEIIKIFDEAPSHGQSKRELIHAWYDAWCNANK